MNRPDAYFACEKSFMTQVHDLFLSPVDISSNHLVIAVHKGNPHNIKTLDDLGKPGLRIGVGNEQQCAMGAITQQTLVQGGKRKKVMDNVKVQTPTGDMLMTQLVSGSLDAVIVYISNTANTKDIEVYSVEGIPCANAVQPMAVGKESQFKHLAGRLMTAIRSRHSRDRFESYGFGWRDRQSPCTTRPTKPGRRAAAPGMFPSSPPCSSSAGSTFCSLSHCSLQMAYTTPGHLLDSLKSREIRYAVKLSLISCSITAILSTWVAVPLGYVLVPRDRFFGKELIDAIVDIPVVLPPLVIGLSLLILFQTPPGKAFERHVFLVTYEIPSVILAQFAVACAFAVRTMRITFDQITPRQEQVALTLGCSRGQAFWLIVLPQARRGIFTSLTISWCGPWANSARSSFSLGPRGCARKCFRRACSWS